MKLVHMLLLSATCLLISEGAEIINGRIAKPHSRPYMAYIKFQNNDIFCGGNLIDSKWVLTAAHCEDPAVSPLVTLGAHLREENANEEGRQKFYVTQFVKYPGYNSRILRNDILLMKLNTTAKCGKFVQSISLPETFEDIKAGTVCETAGWGWTGQKYADSLMEVNVTILDRRQCERHMNNIYISENMICTDVGPAGQDTCAGDSGGPLICNGVFRGILSFGSEHCGQRYGAAVYTRLTEEYVKWIRNKIGAQS
ncbi:granzyme A-like [Hyla sarda]|uniref:granzyme A-like n=1 Tax=Hyla sarda TaxID=327740 RepID=UPI0024C31FF8|nr:granzyme A-like [Hyla sarda]